MEGQLILNTTNNQSISIIVQTRKGKGSEIRNAQTINNLSMFDLSCADNYKRMHNFATPRTGPCGYYNCHGLTFASRRTRITESDDIMRILMEDNYKEIKKQDVKPGDIAIYFNEGDPRHSGIVVSVPIDNNYAQICVVSKWGNGHEYFHALNDCPYVPCDSINFYRVQSVHHGDII